jgi:hypothetical protein
MAGLDSAALQGAPRTLKAVWLTQMTGHQVLPTDARFAAEGSVQDPVHMTSRA